MHNGFDLGIIVNKNIGSGVLERLNPIEGVLKNIYEVSQRYPETVANMRLISYEDNACGDKKYLRMKFIWESGRAASTSAVVSATYDPSSGDFRIGPEIQSEIHARRYDCEDFIKYFEKSFAKSEFQ